MYLRARNYDASIGRFTQEDPIRADGNFYAYCGSNPVNAHDPSGLIAILRPAMVDVDGVKGIEAIRRNKPIYDTQVTPSTTGTTGETTGTTTENDAGENNIDKPKTEEDLKELKIKKLLKK